MYGNLLSTDASSGQAVTGMGPPGEESIVGHLAVKKKRVGSRGLDLGWFPHFCSPSLVLQEQLRASGLFTAHH